MPGRFELKPTTAKIWHAPDNFRIMDPLPPLHRRGIIIGAMLMVIGFLLPSGSDNVDTGPVSRNAELDIQSQSQPQPDSQPMQTQLVTPSNDPGGLRRLNLNLFRKIRSRPPPLQSHRRNSPPALSSSGVRIA